MNVSLKTLYLLIFMIYAKLLMYEISRFYIPYYTQGIPLIFTHPHQVWNKHIDEVYWLPHPQKLTIPSSLKSIKCNLLWSTQTIITRLSFPTIFPLLAWNKHYFTLSLLLPQKNKHLYQYLPLCFLSQLGQVGIEDPLQPFHL